MGHKDKIDRVLYSFNGKWISYAHTVCAYTAFFAALVVGMYLHFNKIVSNEFYGYPHEWFPSVSATIGDRYPERSVFMLFIALTSGPRLALVSLNYLLNAEPRRSLATSITLIGLFRTVMCGGWTYVTSTDDHDWHDIFMISYLVATLPWNCGCILLTPANRPALRYRKIFAATFYTALIPMVYYFIQHKIMRVPGAYTRYAFFEWSLILSDVGFDAATALDFANVDIIIKDTNGVTDGEFRPAAALGTAAQQQNFRAQFNKYSPEILDVLANVFNGYVFWSIYTALGVLIWYFPLWHMGISGFELSVFAPISPLLLFNPTVRNYVSQNLRASYITSVILGIGTYKVGNPAARLLAGGVAVSAGCLAWTMTFYRERNSPQLSRRIFAWTLGLLASSVAKFAFHTNNPAWPILNAELGGCNKTVLVLGILAAIGSTRHISHSSPVLDDQNKRKGSRLHAAYGVAGLVFGMHLLLSEPSTMISFGWEGYPIRGPVAVPHGAMTIFAMGLGILLGQYCPRAAGSWSFFSIACFGAALLVWSSHWLGYMGALIMAVYLPSLAPTLITSALQHDPAFTFGFGLLTYSAMVLFHVWTVAYAFVPLGSLLREHTDWNIICLMLQLGSGVYSASITNSEQATKSRKLHFDSKPQSSRFYVFAVGALQLLAVITAIFRMPLASFQPYHKNEKAVTAGIWTIHFSLDNYMWSSDIRLRDAIRDLEIDVMGLLESDNQRIIMGNRDPTQFMGESLGMYVDYGPGPNKHTWGAALLSKFPIVNSTHHLLPAPVGELPPLIHATLDMYGEMVDVIVFHSGQEEDVEDRRLQTAYLSKLMADSPRPLLLLGYLVTEPLKGNYNTYVSNTTRMKDIDSSDWDRWCEYILYRGVKRTGYARVSRGNVTDTEIQVGKFVIGRGEAEGQRVQEKNVPAGLRFPTMFRGQGVRGHHYHVFDEPRYWN